PPSLLNLHRSDVHTIMFGRRARVKCKSRMLWNKKIGSGEKKDGGAGSVWNLAFSGTHLHGGSRKFQRNIFVESGLNPAGEICRVWIGAWADARLGSSSVTSESRLGSQ